VCIKKPYGEWKIKFVYMTWKILLSFSVSILAETLFAQSLPVINKDIVYSTVDGVSLKLDMASPATGTGPFPAVIHFHGGGWQAGDKSHGHKRIIKLAQAGYVAVSVGYRFAPQYKWPEQVYDAKAAVRFLRDHAKEFNIDPDRIGAVGDSAGGYLALMLGFTSGADGLEGNTHSATSSKVNAVATFCSAGDFTRSLRRKLSADVEKQITEYYNKPLSQVIAEFTGTTEPDDPKLLKMSARTFVDEGDASVLIFHGEKDPLISLEQVEELERALKNAGIPVEVTIVKGEGHGWYGTVLDDTEKTMISYFDHWLKRK
jgi:acetyl esterase/lipase